MASRQSYTAFKSSWSLRSITFTYEEEVEGIIFLPGTLIVRKDDGIAKIVGTL